jgi:hypothetical protein
MADSEECLTCGASLRYEASDGACVGVLDGALRIGVELIPDEGLKERWCNTCAIEAMRLLMRLHKEEHRLRGENL